MIQKKPFNILSWNLKQQIIVGFILLAMLPILINLVLAITNDRKNIVRIRDQLGSLKVSQSSREVELSLSNLESILYNIYTNDEICDLATNLENNIDTALTRNQLRRELSGIFWMNDYITSINIITKSGEVVSYDLLTYSNQKSVCIKALGIDNTEIYNIINSTSQTKYFYTRPVTFFAGQNYNSFYMGHRIVSDNIMKSNAVVLISVDAKIFSQFLLNENKQNDVDSYSFITDENGNIIWYPDHLYLGSNIYNKYNSLLNFIKNHPFIDSKELRMYRSSNNISNWQVVYVLDCEPFTKSTDQRLFLSLSVTFISFSLVIWLVTIYTKRLTHSVNTVCTAIKKLSKGKLDTRVKYTDYMVSEIETIALGFNIMADKLQDLINKQKESSKKIRNAEIAALEAQLNPHVLYNTLDTINWMAIEAEQYNISNIISALAKTMSYGIDFSNSIVYVEEEVNWLKQYLTIHQNRFINGVECVLDIPQEVLSCRVHKLLLQPFIENAMLYAFNNEQTDCILKVSMTLKEENLYIEIIDNGCGIPQEILDGLNTIESCIDCSKRYYGIQNAINRILLYYGDNAKISITSNKLEGTKIKISIPSDIKEGENK